MASLAEKLRPESLGEVVGQEHIKRAINSWVARDEFPRCLLFTGPVGTGKSSIARLIARACQGPGGWEGADIRIINAGTVGKVDDMRALVAESESAPFIGRYRVFILEECHRATDPAQDAVLVPMETNPSTVWILTSSEPAKLLAAIRSRCSAATFEVKPLAENQTIELCERALLEANPEGVWAPKTDEAATWLYKNNIRQPREILGAMDLFFTGTPIEQCVTGAEHEPLYADIAKAVLDGSWPRLSNLLSQVKTVDFRAMVAVVSAFLGSALLEESMGPRGDALATCLVNLGSSNFADGVANQSCRALLYKCCKALGGTR